MSAAAPLRQEVLSAYRHLLKTCVRVFQGDTHTLTMSHRQIREEFRKNAHMSNEQEIQMMVLQAREAAEFMKQSIVQAVKEEGKTEYDVKLGSEQVGSILDATATLNPIDEQAIVREERKVAREKRKRDKAAKEEENAEQESTGSPCGGDSGNNKRE